MSMVIEHNFYCCLCAQCSFCDLNSNIGYTSDLFEDVKILFLTFLIYQKLKFRGKKKSIFLPHPPSEGGTKKMKILKVGRRA